MMVEGGRECRDTRETVKRGLVGGRDPPPLLPALTRPANEWCFVCCGEILLKYQPYLVKPPRSLTVSLGHALDLVLLLDGVAVGGALGGVDELIGEALGDGLDVAEGGLAGAGGDEPDGLVHATEGRDIHSLATDHTGGANAGGVLTGAGVDDGINGDLQGVLVGEEVDDLEGVGDDADSHELLAVVAAVHHQGACEALDDGALGLPEPLLLVASGGVGHKDGALGLDSDVVLEGDVLHLHRGKKIHKE